MLTWMKIKTVFFQMANLVTVLAFHNLEEGQNLEQMEVNCHEEQVKMNRPEEIQHFEIRLAWSSLEYERTSPCHFQNQFCACCW